MPAQYHISGRTARAIAESLERAIDAGRLAGGEALPTIRALAERLEVSPTTVNAAFGILRRRGRIVGRRRGGSIVVARTAFQTAAEAIAPRAHGRNLAVANPDPLLLPAVRGALGAALVERRLYTDVADSPTLLAIAARELQHDGVRPDYIGVAGGTMEVVERALMMGLAPGDAIVLEDPTYPRYLELARALDLRVLRVRVDDRGLLPDGLQEAVRAGAKAVIMVPRAQNPTGASLDARRARELRRALAPRPDLLVIEDDYLAAVAGVPLATLTAGRERWVHVRSYAKALGPDLRVAVFAGDALTVARIRDRQRIGYGWVSVILQDAVAGLLSDPATKSLIRSAERAYRQRREWFVAALAAAGIVTRAESGFTVWVPVPDEATAVRNAQAAGFAIDGGARYRDTAPAGVRVTITTLTRAEAHTLAGAIAGRALHGP